MARARIYLLSALVVLAVTACRSTPGEPPPDTATQVPATTTTTPGGTPPLAQDPGPELRCSVDADCELERDCGPCKQCPGWVPGAYNREWQATSCREVATPPGAPAPNCSPCGPPPDPPRPTPTGVACRERTCVAVTPILTQ